MTTIILVLVVYLIFLLLPIIGMVYPVCRYYTIWNEHDKIKKYYDIKSDFWARILIKKFIGWNQKFSTNISFLYSHYYVNKYPNRISKCSFIQYIIGLVVSIIWIISVNLWFLGINTEFMPYVGTLLIIVMFIISIIGIWNSAIHDFWGGSWTSGGLNMKFVDKKEILTKEEYKEQKKGKYFPY